MNWSKDSRSRVYGQQKKFCEIYFVDRKGGNKNKVIESTKKNIE